MDSIISFWEWLCNHPVLIALFAPVLLIDTAFILMFERMDRDFRNSCKREEMKDGK